MDMHLARTGTVQAKEPSDREQKERKFAVVQWSEGEDSGKLSEVKVENIRGYDDSKMDQSGYPISKYSVVIEWRHGKKQRGGWPHYRGTVLFVSATRFEATRKLNSILKENEPTNLSKRVSDQPDNYPDDSDDSDSDQPLQVKKSKAPERKDPAQEFLAMYSHSPPSATYCDTSPRTVAHLKQKIEDLKEENEKLKDLLVQDVPELMKTMKTVIDMAEPLKKSSLDCPQRSPLSRPGSPSDDSLPLPKSNSSFSTTESATPSASKSQSSKVEIHPGSGVMIDKLAWAYAVNANSATVFVRHLLTAVFPVEILLVSNLRGGKRGRGDAKLPLDKNKVDAIYSATLERWPGTQPSSIGSKINGKITELRAKSKHVSASP